MFGLVPFGSRKDLAAGDAPRSIWDVFNEPFFHDDFFPTMSGFNANGGMRVDVKDNGDSFELTADLPGMKKEDVNLTYQNGYLTIAAQQQAENNQQDDKGNYIRRERRMGSVSRSFYIDNIDESRIDAEFKDGVLTVKMPKAAEVQHNTTINIR
jgi:HSP20 family protein